MGSNWVLAVVGGNLVSTALYMPNVCNYSAPAILDGATFPPSTARPSHLEAPAPNPQSFVEATLRSKPCFFQRASKSDGEEAWA